MTTWRWVLIGLGMIVGFVAGAAVATPLSGVPAAVFGGVAAHLLGALWQRYGRPRHPRD